MLILSMLLQEKQFTLLKAFRLTSLYMFIIQLTSVLHSTKTAKTFFAIIRMTFV